MVAPDTKLVVVIGATGNQGGSVARRFLAEPATFSVRGLTRDPGSPASQALAALGAEMVRADLADPAALARALGGASLVFSVTDYWGPFAAPDTSRRNAEALGLASVREYAYHLELRLGRNVADAAAATVGSLADNGLVCSTLSHAGRCSGGRWGRVYHHDAKADVFPYYVRERHPRLAAKMSCVQTGYFMTSHQILPDLWFAKLEDGSYEMRFSTTPSKVVPHLDPVADMGNFVYAVQQMPPGQEYMAEGTSCSWPDWIAAWSKVTGVPASYRQITNEDMAKGSADRELGAEVADMFSYSSDPGYDGGMVLLKAEDIRKAGIECPMTSLDEWLAKQDWTKVLSKPVTES